MECWTDYEDRFPDGLDTEDATQEFLNGKWSLTDQGEHGNDTGVVFEFDGSELTVSYDDDYIKGSYELDSEELGVMESMNFLKFLPEETSGDHFAGGGYTDEYVDFYFFTVNLGDRQAMIMTPVGNGDYVLTFESIGYDCMYDGWYVFEREDPKVKKAASIEGKEWEKRGYTDDSFYALLWTDNGNDLLLQEVAVSIQDVEWYEGEKLRVLITQYKNNGHALTPLWYKADEDVLPEPLSGNGKDIKPSLVFVSVDEEGKVIEAEYMTYMNLGFFLMPEQAEEIYGGVGEYDEPAIGVFYEDEYSFDTPDQYVYESSTSEYAVGVVINPLQDVKNFKFYSLVFKDMGNGQDLDYLVDELYSVKELKEQEPILIKMEFPGDMPTNAISYEDEDGRTVYYAIYQSGYDGSLGLELLD